MNYIKGKFGSRPARNAGLDEAQAGIKIAKRNTNNLRYTDDTTIWQKTKKN